MQMANIHFDTSKGMAGLISDAHRLNASNWTAVKVSAAKTKTAMIMSIHSQVYEKGVTQDLDLKSSRF